MYDVVKHCNSLQCLTQIIKRVDERDIDIKLISASGFGAGIEIRYQKHRRI